MIYPWNAGVIRYFHPPIFSPRGENIARYFHPGVKILLRYLHTPPLRYFHTPLPIKAIYDRHIIYNCCCAFSPYVYFHESEYSATIYPPQCVNTIWVIILCHYISTPTLNFHGLDYIMPWYIHPHPHMGLIIRTLYFHSRENLSRWIYRNVIFSFPTIFGGGDYIVTSHFHSWQYLVRGWLYRDIIFSLLTIFDEGVIISWHHIFTPDNIEWGGDYIVTSYFHSWQYLVRGWLYRDIIFSLLAIFGEGMIILWHYIYFHCWQYLVRGWLYCDTIFSPLAIFGQGVTSYFHSWQYFVRGWLYRDIIFSPLTIFGQWVIISWHYIFTPGNIWYEGIISWHIFTPDNI